MLFVQCTPCKDQLHQIMHSIICFKSNFTLLEKKKRKWAIICCNVTALCGKRLTFKFLPVRTNTVLVYDKSKKDFETFWIII